MAPPSYALVKYFKEIKVRFYYIFFSFLFTWLCSYYFCEQLIYLCTLPLSWAHGAHLSLIFTELTEAFYISIKTCTLFSFLFLFPVILYQFWLFIKPGLYKFEKQSFIFFSCFFFILSFIIFFFISCLVLPAACKFFLSFDFSAPPASLDGSSLLSGDSVSLPSLLPADSLPSSGLLISFKVKASTYLSFIFELFFWCYFFFQIPFLIFLFLNFGLLTEETLAKKRKLAYLFSLFLSIFLISDALSQLLVFLPFLFFYELAILVSFFFKNFGLGSFPPSFLRFGGFFPQIRR